MTVGARSETARSWAERWWPLLALTLLAGVLRLSTLDLQSFWGDEAFTPVHVLHPSLWATLRGIGRTENTPPLWYVLAWADSRVLGDGQVALRLPSALAGIAAVPVTWAIGQELSGKRAAVVGAAFVAVNPLFVWYSQEARSYGLFVLTAALAMLCFLRAQREPTRGRMVVFALTASLALLTHYFAVFLLIPMVLWLLCEPRTRRPALGATAAIALVGAALIPLIHTQVAHHLVQWIGEWALSSRLRDIPQTYLTGYQGGVLANKGEPLVALPLIAGVGLGLWRMRQRPQSPRAALVPLTLAASGILLPIMLIAVGEDFLAPRNLIGAMIPLTALIAVLVVWPGTGRTGIVLAILISLAFLAVSIDVNRDVNLQREDWRGLSTALAHGSHDRAITALYGFGSSPIEYYLPGFHPLGKNSGVAVNEIDETGDDTVRTSPPAPPAPGFRLLSRVGAGGLVAYRFVSPVPRRVSEAALAGAGRVMTLGRTDVLVR
jgi:mannosyltransferase